MSTATARELVAVLAYPRFKLSAQVQDGPLADLLPGCTVISTPRRMPLSPACRDPSDLPLLQLAFAGKAHYLVAGDKELYAVTAAVQLHIITPGDFSALIAAT